MKKHNPETPIMIREALDVTPKVWARYGQFFGTRHTENTANEMGRVWQGEDGAIEW